MHRVFRLGALVAWTAWAGCSSCSPEPEGEPTPGWAADLEIVFDPAFTSNVGWEVPDNPGDRRRLMGVSGQPMTAIADEPNLENVSFVVDEALLCGPELMAGLESVRPKRLLIAVRDGLSVRGAECLAALPVERFFVAGCLHRPRRSAEACDGDAELQALAETPNLAQRIRGLALSLSSRNAVALLAGFRKLELLAVIDGRDAEAMGVSSLPLTRLRNLRHLDVHAFAGSRAAPMTLAAFARLERLRLGSNLTGALPAPCRLRRFEIWHIAQSDLEGLRACSELEELRHSMGSVESVAPLRHLTSLRDLRVRVNGSDLSPLVQLTDLESLQLSGTETEDFEFLESLANLRRLEIRDAPFQDLSLLSAMSNLETLSVSSTEVTDLSPLDDHPQLTELELSHTSVASIAVIASLPRLEVLSASWTEVRDLSPLRNHPSLRRLAIVESQVSDVSALHSIASLEFLNVRNLSIPAAQLAPFEEREGFVLHD